MKIFLSQQRLRAYANKWRTVSILQQCWPTISGTHNCAIITGNAEYRFWAPNIADFSTISARADSIAEQLIEKYGDVIADCEFDTLIEAARDPGPADTYRSHSPVLTAEWERLRNRFGEPGVDQFNAILMCRVIARSVDRLESEGMPEILKKEYARSYERILNRTETSGDAELHLSADLVAKDLGLCTQRLFSAGYAVIETRYSTARRIAMFGGVRQLLDFLTLYYLKFGGTGPFLSGHFHPELASAFSEIGRIHSFRCIAAIMEWRPSYKALIGTAWYYDPIVAEISPHLAYVRKYPEENGAIFFRGPLDHSGNAFAGLSGRRILFENGKYHPRKYLMVWPRDALLAWSQNESAHHA